MKLTTVDARTLATQILTQVLAERRSLNDCLPAALLSLRDKREQALTQELCYGVLRWLPRLQALLPHLLRKPLKSKDIDLQILLLVGFYQLLYLRIPVHAATAATVEVARTLGKSWATHLINGVLRNFQRQQTDLMALIDADAAVRLAHPTWLLERLQNQWAEQWETIAQANNAHPPFTLRVNARCLSRTTYLEQLQAANIAAQPTPYTDCGITLSHPMDVQQLPGFAQGWVSVQDGAAQLAAPLLINVSKESRILDACAAPGGKTAHLLERYELDKLVAVDNQPERVERLKSNLERLHLSAEMKCADATQLATWWDGQLFTHILLDVPCSATGVIRRHPDIKYLRQATDIATLVTQQQRLLEAVWQLLKPQGQLLFITCSVLMEENHLQLQRFLAKQVDAHEVKLSVAWGHPLPIGRQILPGEENADGFYYASLIKNAV